MRQIRYLGTRAEKWDNIGETGTRWTAENPVQDIEDDKLAARLCKFITVWKDVTEGDNTVAPEPKAPAQLTVKELEKVVGNMSDEELAALADTDRRKTVKDMAETELLYRAEQATNGNG